MNNDLIICILQEHAQSGLSAEKVRALLTLMDTKPSTQYVPPFNVPNRYGPITQEMPWCFSSSVMAETL